MMEAVIIQTDVLKWTRHRPGGNPPKKKINLISEASL